MLRQPLLEFAGRFKLGFLGLATGSGSAWHSVTGGSTPFGLGLMKVCQDALCMLLNNVFWDAFHTKDLDVEACAVGKGIVHSRKVLLMDLAHVHTEACS